ncbi:MAG TPA: lytic murein transglycosylase, partial [Burkholderiales bacterium]|nr:lytic murein transglycosylase [Burkholderiales bacterium]
MSVATLAGMCPSVARMRRFFASACVAFTCIAVAPPASPAEQSLRPDIEAFIDEMVSRHGFEREKLRAAFSRVQIRPGIVRAMSAPATARPWYEFRARYLDALR